jgi:hypothetical protein
VRIGPRLGFCLTVTDGAPAAGDVDVVAVALVPPVPGLVLVPHAATKMAKARKTPTIDRRLVILVLLSL